MGAKGPCDDFDEGLGEGFLRESAAVGKKKKGGPMQSAYGGDTKGTSFENRDASC